VADLPELADLAARYATDRSSHEYLRHYERWLRPLRMQPLVLYEIGIAEGESLRMWREYLPNARIVGIDVREACAAHAGDRIVVEIGDQRDPQFLDDVVFRQGAPHVVIDDGAHTDSAIVDTLEHLFPRVAPGGLYFVEDLHASYAPEFHDRTVSAATYLSNLVHAVNLQGRGRSGSFRVAVASTGDSSGARLPQWERTLASLHFAQSFCVLVRRSAAAFEP
jgi:hypothetical protein